MECCCKIIFFNYSKWNSVKLKDDLETLVAEHSKITKELNSLDDGGSIL